LPRHHRPASSSLAGSFGLLPATKSGLKIFCSFASSDPKKYQPGTVPFARSECFLRKTTYIRIAEHAFLKKAFVKVSFITACFNSPFGSFFEKN
jgi:hypothetical protein